VTFNGVPGSNRGPAGTEDSVGFAQVEATGFEGYARYVSGATPRLIEDLHVHRIRRITLGESTVLTMTAADTVCASDVLPWRDQVCGIVRVVAPNSGFMAVEVLATPEGPPPLAVTVNGGDGSSGASGASPLSIRVLAGAEYKINVSMPSGFEGSRSFAIRTSRSVR
jgi:hypothetical protein